MPSATWINGWIFGVSLLAGASVACGGDGATCAPGTTALDGECVPDVVCGEGTEPHDGTCVPIGSIGEAPIIASVWSPTPFPAGGLLVIEGDHFTNADGGALVVEVGGAAAEDVEILSDDVVVARLPRSDVAELDVAIRNEQGAASTTFRYQGLYAADGGSGNDEEPLTEPRFYVVDPRDGHAALVGELRDEDGVVRAVTGLAEAPDGTLWAVEARLEVDPKTEANLPNYLMTIDPATAEVTLVAELHTAGDPDEYYGHLPDLAFVGDTLMAWTEDSDDLATVDLATGELTVFEGAIGSSGSGLALLESGELALAPEGAQTGAGLYRLDSDGTEVGLITMTSAYGIEEIPALASAGTYLYGAARVTIENADHNGLVRIDPRTGEVVALGELPLHIDALEAPRALPALTARQAPAGVDLRRYAPALTPLPAIMARRPAPPARAVLGDAVLELDARGRAWIALAAVAGAAGARVTSVDGAAIELDGAAAASHRLIENRRGELKLVDADGRVRLRRVVQVAAR
jgi:hypothetical protein